MILLFNPVKIVRGVFILIHCNIMGNNNNIVGNEDPPLGSWCRTEVKFRYAWKLEKFSEMCKTKKNGEVS